MKTKFKVGDKVRIKPSEIKTGFKSDEYYIGERYMNENEILEVNKEDVLLALDATSYIESIDKNIGDDDGYTVRRQNSKFKR